MVHGEVRERTTAAVPAFAAVLGDDVAQLPPVVRASHAGAASWAGRGTLVVRPATTRCGRWLARRAGLPAVRGPVDVGLRIDRSGGTGRECWVRSFGGQVMASEIWAAGGVLREQAGPVELAFRLTVEAGVLGFQHVGTTLLLGRHRLRLPARLGLRIEADVAADDRGGRLAVSVCIHAPVVGRVLSYAGALEAEEVR